MVIGAAQRVLAERFDAIGTSSWATAASLRNDTVVQVARKAKAAT